MSGGVCKACRESPGNLCPECHVSSGIGLPDEVDALQAQLAEARAEVERLKDALQAEQDVDDHANTCPENATADLWCEHLQPLRDRAGSMRRAALAPAAGEKPDDTCPPNCRVPCGPECPEASVHKDPPASLIGHESSEPGSKIASLVERAKAACIAVVEAEPEYPTQWPQDRVERLAAAYDKHGPAFVQVAAQVTVKATKESIAKAIRALDLSDLVAEETTRKARAEKAEEIAELALDKWGDWIESEWAGCSAYEEKLNEMLAAKAELDRSRGGR